MRDVLGAETGFTIHDDPDTVRAPDIAFVAGARRPANPQGFARLAPDLAVEVASPHDQADEIQAKVEEFLIAGTKMVWVVYSKTRSVAVYRSLRDVKILRGDDTLSGEDVLPGFERKVNEIFE
ncbi:MAG: Uma2 family endonuclease [Chloroflexi bacterium]|nr:Uma2 family endonuclease [Chloroflexota bacterium]